MLLHEVETVFFFLGGGHFFSYSCAVHEESQNRQPQQHLVLNLAGRWPWHLWDSCTMVWVSAATFRTWHVCLKLNVCFSQGRRQVGLQTAALKPNAVLKPTEGKMIAA